MSNILLEEIRAHILLKLGLKFNENQEKELYAKLSSAAKAFDFKDTDIFIRWLLTQPLELEQAQKLATFLTIGETYFLREKKALDYLEYDYLPRLINERRNTNKQIKIWSAGCASGEEPYTVAIMLKRILPNIKDWNITILASDINSEFLEKAKKGQYTKWSFRGSSEDFKLNNFKMVEDKYFQLKDEIRNMVTFTNINLASDSFHSAEGKLNSFDIILCRNVLIYFSKEGIQSIVTKFYNSIKENGVLLLSPVETSNLISSKFSPIIFKGFTIYIKTDKKEQIAVNTFSSEKDITYNPLLNKNIKIPIVSKTKVSNKVKLNINSKKKVEIRKREISKESINDSSNYEKALLFYKKGLFEKSEKIIHSIPEGEKTNNYNKLLLLARIYANKGKLVESEKLCLEAINIDKVNANAHYLYATILNEQGKNSEAVTSLNKALYLSPDFALGHFLLGNISLSNNNKTASKKHFENALKCLKKQKSDEQLDESDGITVGRLTAIIKSIL